MRSYLQYAIDKGSLQVTGSTVTADLTGGPAGLALEVLFYEDSVARVRVVEKAPLNGPRWEVSAAKPACSCKPKQISDYRLISRSPRTS